MFDALSTTSVCPRCDTEFTPRRSNQKYCTDPCRKNATRGSRPRENAERTLRHFERSQRLVEMLYKTPPLERYGTMKHILSYVPVDSGLRNILTDPALLSERPRVDGRKNIAKAADAYTKKFFGVSISTYVRKTRNGDELDGAPVKAVTISPPVPNLRPHLSPRNVRCLHKPLASGPLEVIRQMREVAQASREDSAELADSLHLLADVKQAGVVTDADYDRIDAIVKRAA